MLRNQALILSCSSPFQLPSAHPRRQQGGSGIWVPATHCETWIEFLCPGFSSVPAPAIWGNESADGSSSPNKLIKFQTWQLMSEPTFNQYNTVSLADKLLAHKKKKNNFQHAFRWQKNALKRVSTIAHQVKLMPEMLVSHLSAGLSPGYSTSCPALCWCPWEAVKDGSSTWTPATHMGDPNKVLSS